MQTNDDRLCAQILDVVQSIYAADAANYFILDSECPLAKFIEIMHTKSAHVQVRERVRAITIQVWC